jgi:tRNA dimethylallyltransferase
MYAEGLVEEVERLGPLGPTAATAIGYRQAAAFLAGELTREEAIQQTIGATRRFARRQESWYRKDPRIVWVDHDDPDRLDKALTAVRT